MEVIKNPELLPEGGGIYAILIKDGARLLEASGYFDLEDATPWEWHQFDHLYTGETQSLRTRLRRHLEGDIRVSTLRKTLIALERTFRAVTYVGGKFARDQHPELALDDWMQDQVVIGFKECWMPIDAERDLLRRSPSPLNISGRRSRPYSKRLMNARSQLVGQSMYSGQFW